MIVLGLQFGHDGSACVVEDGRILSYVYRERESRVKHAIGLTTREIETVLNRAGIDVAAIDCVGIVSTQNMEILSGLIDSFAIRFERHPDDQVPSPFADLIARRGQRVEDLLSFQLRNLFRNPDPASHLYRLYSAICPEEEGIRRQSIASTGWLDRYVSLAHWDTGATLSEIATFDGAPLLEQKKIKYGFHYPVTVALRGRSIPGYFVHHHVAHGSSCYFRSGFTDAAILTHDGFGNGVGYQSGLVLYGRSHEIVVMEPHHLAIGGLYDYVGVALGLGHLGPAGKLMGLAPYGEPTFFRDEFAGNWYDISRRFGAPHAVAWRRHYESLIDSMGYDRSALAVPARMTEPVNADLAASTQKLFEECYLQAIRSAHGLLLNSGIRTDRLCLSGGTALNCPSNSRIFREGPFDDIFIEPSCGDDGLAIGAALYVYHHLHGHPVPSADSRADPAFLGPSFSSESVANLLEHHGAALQFERVEHAPALAARDLYENKVIAWYERGSEAGPRALGHRSICANPCHAANWTRVNEIKQREWWRPFAPSVLAEEAERWFSGLPAASPYMLFTGQVIGDRLPAIRHVDGSARVQTVDQSVTGYEAMIREFWKLSGVPVVLNTSLNGPGEPIVETPEQAFAFLRSTDLDVLYIEGYRVTRVGASVGAVQDEVADRAEWV